MEAENAVTDNKENHPKFNISKYYPGALLAFFATMFFWGILAILILPVQQELVKSNPHSPKAMPLLQVIFDMNFFLTNNFLIFLAIIVCGVFLFEKKSSSQGELRLKQRKIIVYSVNVVFILYTATCYAISSLLWAIHVPAM